MDTSGTNGVNGVSTSLVHPTSGRNGHNTVGQALLDLRRTVDEVEDNIRSRAEAFEFGGIDDTVASGSR